jgi:hypothetical protein
VNRGTKKKHSFFALSLLALAHWVLVLIGIEEKKWEWHNYGLVINGEKEWKK